MSTKYPCPINPVERDLRNQLASLRADNERLQAVVDKLIKAWQRAVEYTIPVADGSPSYCTAKRVLDVFEDAALAAQENENG